MCSEPTRRSCRHCWITMNFMNRIVEGTGVGDYPPGADTVTEADLADRRNRSYADFGRQLGILPAKAD